MDIIHNSGDFICLIKLGSKEHSKRAGRSSFKIFKKRVVGLLAGDFGIDPEDT